MVAESAIQLRSDCSPASGLFILETLESSSRAGNAGCARALPIAVLVVCAALFLPLRFLSDANPDWRFLSWILALTVATISLSFPYLTGGGSWLRHFAFPILFFLVAVPWPVRIEQMVIQNLMRIVTAINITGLH